MNKEKRNIVVIMTDQHRADIRALEGYPLDPTPFLDEMATQGVWFNRAYTTMPICGPARTSLLTGCWPSSHRATGNFNLNHARYGKDLFAVARENGYATALVGKNHSPLNPEQGADFHDLQGHFGGRGSNRSEQERQFDDWLNTFSQSSMVPTPFPLECQLPYRAVTSATRWIEELAGTPFFMWLSFAEPHNPYQAPEPYYSMFPPENLPPIQADREARMAKGNKWAAYGRQMEYFLPDYRERITRASSNYLGMLRLIDDQIRRFVTFLEQKQLLDNTLIVFVSDHGDFVGEYELMKKGPEAPEILSRIPLQFFGSGVRPCNQAHDAHVSLADIMPTLCDAMECPIPFGVQGRSLWPLLRGEAYPQQEFSSIMIEHGYGGLYHADGTEPDLPSLGSVKEGVAQFDELNRYTQSGWLRSVRKGPWKLNMDMYGKGELYHIEEDPLELKNLYGAPEHMREQVEMLETMSMWLIRCQPETEGENGKYPVKRHPRNYLHG